MQSKLNQLIDKCFLYEGKQFKVLGTKIVNHKATIITDKRTFVFYETELDDFLEIIDLRELSDFEKKNALAAQKTAEIVEKNHVHDVEIIKVDSVAAKMVDSLMSVFDELSNSPTDETYKKAKAMVDVSGAVVNAQVLQLRVKMLRK